MAGKKFPVDVKSRTAQTLPRYFGRGRGVTYYSWTSDQFSQYGTKVITATVRDATYVLDEILGNETELPIHEQIVDTHGFTEVGFAFFSALGLRFSPRHRDVADQRLYEMEGMEMGNGNLARTKGATVTGIFSQKFWDETYRSRSRLLSDEPNSHLVEQASGIGAGRALDVGSGECADGRP